jgi:hypothetical protein
MLRQSAREARPASLSKVSQTDNLIVEMWDAIPSRVFSLCAGKGCVYESYADHQIVLSISTHAPATTIPTKM